MPRASKYRRVLLKLSGEGFAAEDGQPLGAAEVRFFAKEIAAAHKTGVQVAVVVGGGNIVRGGQISRAGIHRAQADSMGMLATVINALALQDALDRVGLDARVQSAIELRGIVEPFDRRRCVHHLDKGCVVILAAGTGNPFFTTDTAAALRAIEIEADALLKATKVDGVYSADPMKDPHAKKFDRLTYMDVLSRRLQVMDLTAISLCMENHLPVVVFNMARPGNIQRVIRGERIGTWVGLSDPEKVGRPPRR
ncbi:MAG: UMP kinase [Planctomycetes bacterium]|nr:UMP kinase [Planctomycetota bacterium]